jgi:hypothetical protein
MSLTRVRSDLVDTTTIATTFANTVTFNSTLIANSTATFNSNISLSSNTSLVANGSSGSSGQILYTNGTSTYWATNPSVSVGKSIAMALVFGG